LNLAVGDDRLDGQVGAIKTPALDVFAPAHRVGIHLTAAG
jgi:hypothetical protein